MAATTSSKDTDAARDFADIPWRDWRCMDVARCKANFASANSLVKARTCISSAIVARSALRSFRWSSLPSSCSWLFNAQASSFARRCSSTSLLNRAFSARSLSISSASTLAVIVACSGSVQPRRRAELIAHPTLERGGERVHVSLAVGEPLPFLLPDMPALPPGGVSFLSEAAPAEAISTALEGAVELIEAFIPPLMIAVGGQTAAKTLGKLLAATGMVTEANVTPSPCRSAASGGVVDGQSS
mmetsp:Transcript_55377/g.154250  ORF Transcript_55377/g.154250 Transcript_55377/m.154250 type:complete len:243 (-) Transcript_55377:67-795(-)|eukprot:CAMPEP_0117602038 /NCGR_PEP_ID=MMETSP0784-20121206/77359_1 /TAXON_ID=39447 /ORGANISM="" /LENGTH=242 /DNA_ID=CAMNT_0005404813 /DNA_START=199 /DNA_END=927 /DNA_ORIENTATION=+